MKERLRALFVLPSLMRAGAETQLVNLVNGLDSKRYKKHLLVFEKKLEQLDRIDREQVEFHHVPRRLKLDLKPALEIARVIDEHKIEVVHCTLQIALLYGWLGVRFSKLKPPLVSCLHTTINRDRKSEIFDYVLYQWLMRACARVICVCKVQETHWLEKFPFLKGKTEVIYNGIDVEYFSRAAAGDAGSKLRQELHVPSDAFVFCCIAGFRPEKDHDILIEAFARIAGAHKNTFLLLAGDGALRGEIERKVEESGLAARVLFLGNRADVRPVLAASDCSVLASKAVETFSLAILESFAMKVPVIVTDVGGAREAVKDEETGYIVPPGNTEKLAFAMETILKDPLKNKAMGAKARAFVAERFQVKSMINETSELLLALGK